MHVVKPGLLTTVQDPGRWGFSRAACRWPGRWIRVRIGWPTRWSATIADAATLEVTLVGPELEFEDERLVAVTGAEFDVRRRRPPRAAERAVRRRRRIAAALRRARPRRARLSRRLAGGIAVPLVLGSRATHLVSALGGLDGRALQAGDRLPLGDTIRGRRIAATCARRAAHPDRA